MTKHLIVSIRFHDGRYQGEGDWPPCPARLFQALVAAAGIGGRLDNAREALRWLETLPAPLIGAPHAQRGQRVMFYMPNNDLDAVGGDPRRLAEIRTAKKYFHPRIFEPDIPFFYAWEDLTEADGVHAKTICDLAEHVYQLGRGLDMAWAWGEILDDRELDARLAEYPGRIYRPSTAAGGKELECPYPGALAAVERRYQAFRRRFRVRPAGTSVAFTFEKPPPRPTFRRVAYDSPPVRLLYELRRDTRGAELAAWPLERTVRLVETVRDLAASKLKQVLQPKAGDIDSIFGLARDAAEADKARRIRVVPLPSIGHPHADQAIRRLLVEIPPDCPLARDDIAWAFSGLDVVDGTTGEILCVLIASDELGMLRHYGIAFGDKSNDEKEARDGISIWHTVTPMALPVERLRGRKNGTERLDNERSVAAAVMQALRHAAISAKPTAIRVQREPFDANGTRAERFASGTRFPAARLWHVEITFGCRILGPLLAGDGRYLGLGLMKPVKMMHTTSLTLENLEAADAGVS